MKKVQNTVITVSRQTASGGSFISRSLARQLGYDYIDREVLYEAAKLLGADLLEISRSDEKTTGFLESLVKSFALGSPETCHMTTSRRPIYDRELFEAEARIIRKCAEKLNAVIVGHGAFHVLKGRPGVIHVFFHAPMDFRIARIMKARDIHDPDRARYEIEESDRQKENFVRNMTGTLWTDARNYHLCLETSSLGFDTAGKMIMDLVEAKTK